MTYFYVEPHRIQNGRITIEEQVFKHIVQVRRCRAGDIIHVIDGTSREYEARIQSCGGKTCIAEVIRVKDRICEPPVTLTLYQALVKIPRFEIILEKAVELGVSEIVPLLSERSVFTSREIGREKLNRWQKIMVSAACQCGRTKIPGLSEIVTFEEALRNKPEKCRLIFSPHSENSSLKEALSGAENLSTAGVFIGPEGGFTGAEIDAARSAGVKEVYLGPRILRAETAAIASTAIVMYELEGRMSGI